MLMRILHSNRTIRALPIALGLIVVMAAAAGAGRRHVDEYAEGSDDLGPGSPILDSDASYSEAEKAKAERLGQLEAAFTAANQPAALFDQAENDGLSTDGLALGQAIDSAGPSRISAMRLVDVQSETADGVVWEQLMFADGSPTGYLMVWWQSLLGDEATAPFAGEFGVITDEGEYDLIVDTRGESDPDFRLVRLYDGSRILSVLANDISGVEIDELVAIAKALFRSLPTSS